MTAFVSRGSELVKSSDSMTVQIDFLRKVIGVDSKHYIEIIALPKTKMNV
jgi:hypothetical protein